LGVTKVLKRKGARPDVERDLGPVLGETQDLTEVPTSMRFRQPGFQQMTDLRTFHSTPYCVHQLRVGVRTSSPETYPIRNMDLARDWLSADAEISYPEKPGAEDEAPNLHY